jgi:hypothetical protein
LTQSKIDNAKETFMKIEKYGLTEYFPTKQIVDIRNKCKYFIIKDKYLLPVKPSGTLFWIPIEYNYEPYVNDLNTTVDLIYEIYIKSNKNIKTKPIGIYYSNRDTISYKVNAIIIDRHINVPIISTTMTNNNIIDFAKKYKIKELLTESQSIYDIIDNEIIKYNPNNIQPDARIIDVNNEKYHQEGYELFRLELAYYVKDQKKLRDRIIKLLK